jgi:hypothetical protein
MIGSIRDGQTPTSEAGPWPKERPGAGGPSPRAHRPSPATVPALRLVLHRGRQHVAAVHDGLAALQQLPASVGYSQTDDVTLRGLRVRTRQPAGRAGLAVERCYFFLRGTAASAAG